MYPVVIERVNVITKVINREVRYIHADTCN